jgi:hypothetical protein
MIRVLAVAEENLSGAACSEAHERTHLQSSEGKNMMNAKDKIVGIQKILFPDQPEEWDGKPGKKWATALASLETDADFPAGAQTAPTNKNALGDGTWSWAARIDGDDVLVENARMTCFGGSDDPQDSGETASGISTKRNPDLAACSLPMDGRMFPALSRAEHAALDGSPIPRVPWKTLVRVTVFFNNGAAQKTVDLPVIDLGPGKRTGNALDLTIAAARLFNPKATATNFEARGNYRILGGAKYVKASA